MKHLLLTGDDFGRSPAVNEAIERHHRAGLLSQASLMVHEPAVDEAIRIAQRNPQLCVGLHLTLCAGRAARPSPLTDSSGAFCASPALAGLRYAFDPRLAAPLAAEIAAQFSRFRALGLPPTYVDGHTHLHLHPAIFRASLPHLAGFALFRLVCEPGNQSPVARIFRALSASARRRLPTRAADRVFGLRDSGRMTGERLAALFHQLPSGLSEIYFHPGAEPTEPDFGALREVLHEQNITLVSAATLPPPQTAG